MRIGLSIETDRPGGAEVMVFQLARQLLDLGHEVVSLGPVGGEGWLTARLAEIGVERDLVEFRGFFQLGTVPQVAEVVRRRRLDVLHSHEFGMAVCGAYATYLRPCRHVITLHGGTYFANAARRRHGMRLAMAMSRHSVAVSEASRLSFAKALGVRPSAFSVVHNGVEPSEPGDGRLREELGLAPDDHLVVAIGNLLEVKGHVTLLEARARLDADPGRVVVAIAGRGPEEERLRARADDLGISDDVFLLGFREDVADILHAADVFAMPSNMEQLPMSIIEAMLAEKAIVASRVGGIPELLPDPDHGLLVEPADPDALARGLSGLLRNAELRCKLGAAGRARAVQHFTARAMAENYLPLYES